MQAFSKFKEEKVELIISGGDFIDAKSSVPITVMEAYAHLLRQAPAPVVDVLSNHGASDRVGIHHAAYIFVHRVAPHWRYDVATITPSVYGAKGKESVCVFGIMYRSDVDIKEFYEDAKAVGRAYNKTYKGKYDNYIILIHQGIKEAKLKNAPFELEKNISAKKLLKHFSWADLIIAGHYHDPQKLDRRLVIPGAICQHNFRDCGGKRGFWIYDTKTNGLKFYKTDAPKFHQVDFEALDKLECADGDYVRVLVEIPSQIERARKKLKNVNLSFSTKPKKASTELRDSSMTFSLNDYDLLVKYLKNKKPKDIKPKIIKKFGRKIIKSVMEAS